MNATATERRQLREDLDIMLRTTDRMRRLLVDVDHPAAAKVVASLARTKVVMTESLKELGGSR